MPELPEVETLCRDMRNWDIFNNPIQSVQVAWNRTVLPNSVEEFCQKVTSKSIVLIDRKGKYLDITLDDGMHILAHLRMTGSFRFSASLYNPGPYDRVIFTFEKGTLVFSDPRKFGRIQVVDDPQSILIKLGYDPFDPHLDEEKFYELLNNHRKRIKTLLLDQTIIAGLGNIYTDESLFNAFIHPLKQSSSLSRSETNLLLKTIRSCLVQAIGNRGTSLGDGIGNFRSNGHAGTNAGQLNVYQRTGKPCIRCGTLIERIVVGQRSTHYCPNCQR
ncbi:MAG: DNA-formamidopyrimidine glycosylase [Sphaerochaetaceae bacterium]|nr:DNA-formamidopyrimidine glycosylase [Sphaerochaetaceae bacterium]NLO60334.1 DNA-formamidopyrimidine glycosylase [Spirochaetales bacterium]MDD2405900.1 DNA-formamidopyrimidine glycosylase [Sphaerochaetaceae bacterium]MDD3670527.1 DNA-formamidopyrimidine glycosylase [Sphaerochaetaceae bacterium]MDD4260074.1 DNA-formamidopyrimidine glycosylase [Sphaerochaetaceae bacterium]